MPERGSRGPGAGWLALGCALVAILHAASFLPVGPCDDDYIVYRYARNLVAGHGLVFQPGERVEGFTVPLWVLVLAGALRAGLAPEVASQALGVLAAGAAALAVGLAWTAGDGRRWPVPALLVAASPAVAYHAALGLGTTALAALFAWGHLLHARRAPWSAATCLGLAGLLRPEALLLAAPFALVSARARRPGPAALALAPPFLWAGFRWAYYGELLPVPYLVKKLSIADDLTYGLAYLGRATLESGVALLALLALVHLLALGRERRLLSPEGALVQGLLLHTAYVVLVGGDYMDLGRFFVPTLPLLFLAGARGAARFLPEGTTRAVALVAALLLLQLPQRLRPDLAERHAFQEERWIAVGRALGAAAPGRVLATSPIGAIGWHSGLPIVDLLGVTNDAVWRAAPDLSIDLKGHHRHDAAWVLAEAPDLFVLGNGVIPPGTQTLVISAWERELFEHPDFQTRYAAHALDVPGSYPLILHVREGALPPAGARPIPRRR